MCRPRRRRRVRRRPRQLRRWWWRLWWWRRPLLSRESATSNPPTRGGEGTRLSSWARPCLGDMSAAARRKSQAAFPPIEQVSGRHVLSSSSCERAIERPFRSEHRPILRIESRSSHNCSLASSCGAQRRVWAPGRWHDWRRLQVFSATGRVIKRDFTYSLGCGDR